MNRWREIYSLPGLEEATGIGLFPNLCERRGEEGEEWGELVLHQETQARAPGSRLAARERQKLGPFSGF